MTRPAPRALRGVSTVLVMAAIFAVTDYHMRAAGRHDVKRQPPRVVKEGGTLSTQAQNQVRGNYLATPMRFEPTDGADSLDFVARGAGYQVGLAGGGARIVLSSPAVRDATGEIEGQVRSVGIEMRLAGSRRSNAGQPLHELAGVSNQLIGNEPRHWRTGIKGFQQVRYSEVYPGIDVVYYGKQRQLEYDFIVRPGASSDAIALVLDGATDVRIDRRGNLVIQTPLGDLIQHAPVIYQEGSGGKRERVNGGYVVKGENTVGFRIGRHDRRRPLVIDPVLSYATYLGGSGIDHAFAVAVDGEGNMLVAGFTLSTNFPQAGNSSAGFVDAFVAKLNAQGNALIYATYLGGSSSEYVSGLHVDAEGNAYVAGTTESRNFPTLRAAQPVLNGWEDAFVAKLDPAGALVYSTYLGGRNEELGYGIAVDGSGRAYVTGWTASADFPVANPIQASTGGSPAWRTTDGGNAWSPIESGLAATFVLSIAVDPSNTNTLYAGTYSDGVFKSDTGGETWTAVNDGLFPLPINAIAIDPASATVYAGSEMGVFFSSDGGAHWNGPFGFFEPVTSLAIDPGVPGTVYAGVSRGFSGQGVMKSTDNGQSWTATGLAIDVLSLAISPTAPATLYAGTTHGVFRMTGGEAWTQVSAGLPHSIRIEGLARDPNSNSTLYAATEQGLFRTTTGGDSWSLDPVLSGFPLFRVVAAGTSIYTTSYTGAIASDDAGETWRVAGLPDTPVYGLAVDPVDTRKVYATGFVGQDAFVTRLSPEGSAIEFSTFFGGTAFDYGSDVAVDATGDVYIVGATQSTDLPVRNAVQTTFKGVQDLFVAKMTSGGSLEYATYLGGFAWEDGGTIGVDAAGRAHVAAYTLSQSGFPVVNAHQPVYGGGETDMVVSKLSENGSSLLYSTYLGGSGSDHFGFASLVRIASPALAVSPAGEAFVAGTTSSTNFPLLNPVQAAHAGGLNDAFVAKLGAAGALEYSTYLGGSGPDSARAVAVDSDGSVVVAGLTSSTNFPTRDPFQAALGGEDDAFVARIAASEIDTSSPVVSISSPQERDYIHSDRITVAFTASDLTSGLIAGSPSATLDGSPVVNGQVVSLLSMPLGSHTLVATATDTAGNVGTRAVTFRVIATVGSLIEAVNAFAAQGSIDTQTQNGLLAKLSDAQQALERGRLTTARSKLRDFIDQVNARSGHGITVEAAALLKTDAEYVIGTI